MAFGSPRTPRPLAANVTATVKWYNKTKGFGFVSPGDGSADAFLHASAIELLGHDSLPDGATLIVDLAQGPKGPQVTAVHSVDLTTATQSFRSPSRGAFPKPPGRDRYVDVGPTEELEGTVKWFNTTKGFGFIALDSGGKDVFVHTNAVQRSGLNELPEGSRVRAEVRQGQKGPEAVRVEIL